MSVGQKDAARLGHKEARKKKKLRLIFGFLFVLGATLLVGEVLPASAQSAPTVTRVSPSSGPLKGGQTVVITGTNFTGATAVKFDTTAATSFAVMNEKQIVAVVPDASAAGSVLVEVTTSAGANTSGANYEYKAPSIKKMSPGWAKDSASSFITITGTGLLGTVAADVKFGTWTALNVWVISDSQIVVETPIDDAGSSIDVTNGVTDVVITRNSVASATDANSKFLFTPGLPTITTLGTTGTPVTGTDGASVGSTMTITGTQLWGVSEVKFGTTKVTNAADITVATDGNSMTVKVPSRSNGPVDVTVTNAAGASLTNLSTRFSYFSTTAPTISSVTPGVLDKTATTGGGTILVSGRGLTGVGTSNVTVVCASNITPTSATSITDTSLILVVPDNGGTAETCDLKIDNPTDNTKTTTKTDAIRYV